MFIKILFYSNKHTIIKNRNLDRNIRRMSSGVANQKPECVIS